MCVRKKAAEETLSPPADLPSTRRSNEPPPPAPPPVASAPAEKQAPLPPPNPTPAVTTKSVSVAPASAPGGSKVLEKKKSIAKKAQSCKDPDVLRPPSNMVTPKAEKKKALVIVPVTVDPPKIVYARRKIDEVREAKAAEYKTLAELDVSEEWESAEIIPRTELKKEQAEQKNSKKGESKKSSKQKKYQKEEEAE